MGPADRANIPRIVGVLRDFDANNHPLPGILGHNYRDVFVLQLLESMRRVRYISVIKQRPIDPRRIDPTDDLFDPIKAAAFLATNGDLDEAFWQVFISVHFGRHVTHGWRCARAVYGGLGTCRWTWEAISADPEAFRTWLAKNQEMFKAGGPYTGFGNHRKYQSLDAMKPNGTGDAFVSYVNWVGPNRSHATLVRDLMNKVENDPKHGFANLYMSMAAVASFGRTARFDYLTMLSKLQLAPIVPDGPYLLGATGPLRGARLMFLGDSSAKSTSARILETRVKHLGGMLDVGMQEMEDALCNWQKSPGVFQPFRG